MKDNFVYIKVIKNGSVLPNYNDVKLNSATRTKIYKNLVHMLSLCDALETMVIVTEGDNQISDLINNFYKYLSHGKTKNSKSGLINKNRVPREDIKKSIIINIDNKQIKFEEKKEESGRYFHNKL